MSGSEAGSSSTGSVEEVTLYHCRKCNDGVEYSVAEIDAHRQMHRDGRRRTRPTGADTRSGTTFVQVVPATPEAETPTPSPRKRPAPKSARGKKKVRKVRPEEDKIQSKKKFDKEYAKENENLPPFQGV